jgi:fanconi-associated nuclease 1
MAIPGAFETPYQTAPLDLWTNTFFSSRAKEIQTRISELEEGKGLEILNEVDDRERPNNTWCVGIHWEKFSKMDLLEMVKVSAHA